MHILSITKKPLFPIKNIGKATFHTAPAIAIVIHIILPAPHSFSTLQHSARVFPVVAISSVRRTDLSLISSLFKGL